MATTFQLNGEPATFDGDPETPLLWVLRDHLGLTGTKYGCGVAQCGACTVHLDGKNRRSCVTPVGTVAGKSVTTIEGASGKVADAVKAAWVQIDVPQCGFCQSGQVMSAIGLLTAKPKPTDKDIDAAMAGNLCRCATYVRIRQAIKDAAGVKGERA
ncbi:isoquinoline 1-oxidoreductase alpha subunit [Sphingomonas sp. BE123]|jgi:isoquinoline 1-oxidoreductase alpha subunit|uniref:(2Fe-2S)-binding protein n=1 Tax=unclassified Sphingomonas TaxID=196159 RepID=UPI00285DFFD7|nr:2Fe-2S iron-sulfur cluster-binding protein [Sphingomonas sp. BE123]MDR6852095.1 isoquinoline 1-oxidoreductase alpha subunit [Sphingomonas sp. BE123]